MTGFVAFSKGWPRSLLSLFNMSGLWACLLASLRALGQPNPNAKVSDTVGYAQKKIRIIGEVGIKAVPKERFYIRLPTPKMSS